MHIFILSNNNGRLINVKPILKNEEEWRIWIDILVESIEREREESRGHINFGK